MITMKISQVNPELSTATKGDLKEDRLRVLGKFEREVPDDFRELKIYTGFRDYDFNQRRRLTFMIQIYLNCRDKTRLTSLETIIFRGCFNHC